MRICDVEVLDVTIGDAEIARLLVGAQQDAVRQALAIAAERRRIDLTREKRFGDVLARQLAGTPLARLLEAGVPPEAG